MMDGWIMDALLCISKNKASFIPIIKAWKSQDMFYYNFDCVWLREKKSYTPRMA